MPGENKRIDDCDKRISKIDNRLGVLETKHEDLRNDMFGGNGSKKGCIKIIEDDIKELKAMRSRVMDRVFQIFLTLLNGSVLVMLWKVLDKINGG